MEKVDIVIVGAGVVGLAVAAELSQKNKNTTIVILEKYDKITGDRHFFKGCPVCKTDDYLMDLVVATKEGE